VHMPSGLKSHWQPIGDAINAFASAFPDVHRDLLNIYVAKNVVFIELAIWERIKVSSHLPQGLSLQRARQQMSRAAMFFTWSVERSSPLIVTTRIPR
jgi:hypothetical protein